VKGVMMYDVENHGHVLEIQAESSALLTSLDDRYNVQ
jgi:hypothetical protein